MRNKQMNQFEQACFDIYKDYCEEQIEELEHSIVIAWHLGKDLSDNLINY